MGLVDVRHFSVATRYGSNGELEPAGISPMGESKWDVDLTGVILANGLATPVDRPFLYPVLLNELRVLLSYLADSPGAPLALRQDEFKASSGHVKRLISESFGLGMLTAAVEHHHKWLLDPSSLHNFDVLPTSVARHYSSSGIRPDLLFEFGGRGPGSLLAGEARGRSSARPANAVTKNVMRRLTDIVTWSGVNDVHPVTMTYAYTGAGSAQVDLFDIAVPGDISVSDDLPGRMRPWRADRGEGLVATEDGRVFELMSYIGPRTRQRAAEIIGSLYETAPQDRVALSRRVYGHPVRGNWATANLIGQTDLRFFLGVLDEALTPEQAGELRSNSLSLEDDPIRVAVSDRLLAVVARDAGEDPNWSEVTRRFE